MYSFIRNPIFSFQMSKRLTYTGKNEVRISPNIICDNPYIFNSAKFNVLKCFTVIDSSQYPVTLIYIYIIDCYIFSEG